MLFVGLGNSACSKPTDLEGAEWRLIELASATVVLPPGGKPPSLTLDSGNKKATGFTGCNNYFAQYELSGTSLTFGPAGTTRRACPEAQNNVERKLLAALEKARTWQITDSTLLLLSGGDVLARFIKAASSPVAADLDSIILRSSVYTEYPVTLSKGEFRIPAEPGSASEIVVKLTDKRAFGQLAGIDIGVVVITTETGGTGTFYELALLTTESEGWENSDTVLLGDRLQVNSVAIAEDSIVVEIKTHGPDDPQCCPTMDSRKRYTIQNGLLVEINDTPMSRRSSTVLFKSG